MTRPRVLLTGAGGPAAIGVTRSLARTGRFDLVGTDCNAFALCFAETAARYLVPPASDPGYLAALDDVIAAEGVDFVHAQPDSEVLALSEHRDDLAARTLLPAPATVRVCQDKYESTRRWADAGVRVPATLLLTDKDDLAEAFARFTPPFWVRATQGYGGRGAAIARDLEDARRWVDGQDGWGTFVASEMLPGRLVTWQSLWLGGELVCAQGRERLSWAMGSKTASGVSGMTGVARTVTRPDLDAIGRAAVLAVDDRPHGIFGVDLKENADGVPCPTEINVGRFFTTIQFFTELGLNMPAMYVAAGLGEAVQPLAEPCNPLPPDWYWLRAADSPPQLVHATRLAALPAVRGARADLVPDSTVTYGL